MTTTYEPSEEDVGKPLVLHIRRLRQWHGTSGLSQADLSTLSGVAPRQLHAYETARTLPHSLEQLLSIALVLKVPLEHLIAPGILARLAGAIEARTGDLEITVLGSGRASGASYDA